MASNRNRKTPFDDEKNEWDDITDNKLLKNGKSTDHTQLDAWVQQMKRIVRNTTTKSTLTFDNQPPITSDVFNVLKEGRPMIASGNFNDCLIHSFLTCVSKTFSQLTLLNRNKIAHYFRRFILPELLELKEPILSRFQSHAVLSTSDAQLLAEQFKIAIVILQDGDTAAKRSCEVLFPDDWNRGPFIVIHGNNVHFTPVSYTGRYIRDGINKDVLVTIAEKVTNELIAEMDISVSENLYIQHLNDLQTVYKEAAPEDKPVVFASIMDAFNHDMKTLSRLSP